MREAELLRHIAARSSDLHGAASAFGRIELGPGDDCAVVLAGDGSRLVIGVDQVVCGRHFLPELLESDEGLNLVARKAVARAVSDVAAMGARPCWGLATGVLPAGFARADALFDAMAGWARRFHCPLIGGDIASLGDGAGPLSLTVTAAGGLAPGAEPLRRSGARVGDVLWLTGPIGGSVASGWHLRFEPRVEAGLAAAASGRVHAAIDLSDGLGRDAARVGEASGVVLELHAARLPLNHRCNGWLDAASEGEDYELLLSCAPGPGPLGAAAPFQTLPELLGPVGVVRACRPGEAPGAVIVDAYGLAHDAADLGWNH